MSQNYAEELNQIVHSLVLTNQSFDILEIRDLIESALKESGKYHDQIVIPDLKNALISIYEKGEIPGYFISTKPLVDDEGPACTLEFTPSNQFASVNLVGKPQNAQKLICYVDFKHKELIKFIASNARCSQDMMVRSILVKSLMMIQDHMI